MKFTLAAGRSYLPMPTTPKTNAIPPIGTSRRAFCGGAAALLLGGTGLSAKAFAQAATAPSNPLRPDVAAIDHDRILAAAARYLTQAPTPLTSLQCARSPGTVHDYYSEAEPAADPDGGRPPTAAPSFTAHRDALFTLGLAVPAMAGAYTLTGEERYAEHAAVWLRTWLIAPETRMAPSLDFGQVLPTPGETRTAIRDNSSFGAAPIAALGGRSEGILETLPLVEIAQAIPFLAASAALTESDQKALQTWFAAYLRWLTEPQDSGPRLGALARDRKDHHASSWLLQVSAYTILTVSGANAPKSEDRALTELRHRFKTVTLRAQISPDGTFPHELSSATPYRDSLFNLDMLAAVCLLLTTRFESVWEYQLEDGPGMRSAIAYHFPFIADRSRWPFRADVAHFNELPARRSSLLFTARAYQRPAYATLWKTLPPDPATPDVLRTLPVHQPLLWVRQPPRV